MDIIETLDDGIVAPLETAAAAAAAASAAAAEAVAALI